MTTLLRRDPAFQDLEVAIDGNVPAAWADANLLTIAVQNLLINAAQAQHGRGTVRVNLRPAGAAHRIQIIDQGPGIPAEILADLFRPFKTTKARGTGLGMATASASTPGWTTRDCRRGDAIPAHSSDWRRTVQPLCIDFSIRYG